MTSNPNQDSASPSAGGHSGNRLSQWAVGLAAVVAVFIALTGALFAVAYVRGGSDAISDNWVGILGVVAILGGLVISLAAFVLAIVARRIKRDKWAWLWLPLSLFPALFAFVVLGELFWWE